MNVQDFIDFASVHGVKVRDLAMEYGHSDSKSNAMNQMAKENGIPIINIPLIDLQKGITIDFNVAKVILGNAMLEGSPEPFVIRHYLGRGIISGLFDIAEYLELQSGMIDFSVLEKAEIINVISNIIPIYKGMLVLVGVECLNDNLRRELVEAMKNPTINCLKVLLINEKNTHF